MNNTEEAIELKWNKAPFFPEQNIVFHFWRNGKVGLHSHEYFELFLITEGRVLHEWNGASSTLEQGTLCLIKPHDRHRFTPYENEPTVHFNVKIKSELFESLCEVVSSTLYDKILSTDKLIKYKLKKHEYEYFMQTIKNANCDPAHKTGKSATPLMKVLATNFLLYINSSLKAKKKSYPKWFSAFLEALNSPDSFSKPLSELYALSAYSQTRLNTYFHTYMGTTLIAYITKQKINYACNLLRTTNYTVLQIALMSGFHNLSRFNAVFKQTVGETPTTYRQRFARPTP